MKVSGKKAHSTQKPAELLYRIIISTSNLGDLVLDPFMGRGTTAVVAKRLGRNFISFEKEKTYMDVANNMLKKIVSIKKELLLYKIENKKPKVGFGNLIEKGYVKIGEKLYSRKKDKEAVVQADASIESGNEIGSIHEISAKILNKESNNCWDFWYVLRNNELISIDSLRYAYKRDFSNKSKDARVVQIKFKENCVEELNSTLLKYVAESKKNTRNKV
nr:site-specific DNA-methyltransferase [Candidatus Endomicrobium trichonymphae]